MFGIKFGCMNALSLPVDKQHDITSEISEKKDIQKGQTYKIKIIAIIFMNMNRKKWML